MEGFDWLVRLPLFEERGQRTVLGFLHHQHWRHGQDQAVDTHKKFGILHPHQLLGSILEMLWRETQREKNIS